MRISDWSSDVCSSDLSEPSFHTIARWFFWGGFQLFIFARRPLLPCNRLPCEPPNPRPRPLTSFDSEMRIGNHVDKAAVLEFIERRPSCLWVRSAEHKSELQSLMRISYAVFCLTKK